MLDSKSRKSFIVTKAGLKRLAVLFTLIAIALLWCSCTMINMPGKSFRGPLPMLTESQAALAEELRRDVHVLAGEIGPRSVLHVEGLAAAADFIQQRLIASGYAVQRQTYRVWTVDSSNLEVEIKGKSRPDEIIIVGAHYDSDSGSNTAAANDNGSGVAATLALAHRFALSATGENAPSRTLRFVFFVNEEPPFFLSEDMGSLVYARRCKERGEKIVGMISLETIGYYSDQAGSQTYPIASIGWLYPDAGNFIGFVGNFDSRKLVRRAIKSFRAHAQFPSEGAALPGWIAGVGWSDHWSFWQVGYPAIMLTDTAPFRYPHYHTPDDTPEKLDYERMARVVEGVQAMIADLVNQE